MPLYLVLILVLSALGILNTLYLSSHVLTKAPVKCLFFPKEWCEKVQYSSYSRTFGIPNPFLGLGMYIAIVGLVWLFAIGTLPFWPLAAIIIFGFAFSMYFIYIQAVVLKAFCTWCVVSAVEFTLLFLIIVSQLVK